MKVTNTLAEELTGNHSHAWRSAWNRPMLMDEDKVHPFDVARMTDHNVRGADRALTETLEAEAMETEIFPR
jgi:hypothetical protein